MIRIGLLSDTHGYLPPRVFDHFANCDEIWHAGDIGTTSIIDQLLEFKPCRMVYGNVDGTDVRKQTKEHLVFSVEGLRVMITHIGGYPGRYNQTARAMIERYKPGLFICGHSHILKVQFDSKYKLLHINPGAAGNHGWHQVMTIVRFAVNEGRIQDLEVIELGKRGQMAT